MGEKRFYWIKLKTDFFNQETIDFLLSQKNGCEYIVLYQMLCLQTANSNGQLSTKIGEMIIPYNVDKIVRDTKYFDFDTVTVALELFKKLGLIYQDDNNVLSIAGYDSMIGSESKSAAKMRRFRENNSQKLLCGSQCDPNVTENVTEKASQCDIEKDIEKDIEIEKSESKPKRKRFTPPTLEEVQSYCIERNNNVDPQHFIDYYTSNGWQVGKNKMKDWKAAVRTWERNGYSKPKSSKAAEELDDFYNMAHGWAEREEK